MEEQLVSMLTEISLLHLQFWIHLHPHTHPQLQEIAAMEEQLVSMLDLELMRVKF